MGLREGDAGVWRVTDLDDASQVGAARREAARLAEFARLPDTIAGQLGLIVVELATNLLKHAVRGRLLMRAEWHEAGEAGSSGVAVDVLAIDHGPGMDLERCYRDGFSTGGTSGTGLGAVRRLATVFDAWSDARGSVLFARIGELPGPRRGSVCVPLKGELESGDGWRFALTPQGWSALVVDGLGHGGGAAEAAAEALAAHRDHPVAPARCLAAVHARSRDTRGSACATVAFDEGTQSLLHGGVGNVAVTVVGLQGERGIAGQNGTLGGACPTVRETREPVPARGLVVLHTDGLSGRWSLSDYPGLRGRHPQIIAGALFRDMQRPRDDATVLVIEA